MEVSQQRDQMKVQTNPLNALNNYITESKILLSMVLHRYFIALSEASSKNALIEDDRYDVIYIA